MVSDGDPVGTTRFAAPTQVGVSLPPCRRLDTLAGEAEPGDLQPIRLKRYPEVGGDPARVSRPSTRLRVEGVIEVGSANSKVAAAGEFVQRPEEGSRIGAAGERDDDLAAGLERSVPEEEALDMVDERLTDCPLRSRGLGGVPLPTRMVAVKGLEPPT